MVKKKSTAKAKVKPKLGSGARFKALSSSLAKKNVADPNALAAVIGQKKYGKAKMAKMSAAGRKKKSRMKAGMGM